MKNEVLYPLNSVPNQKIFGDKFGDGKPRVMEIPLVTIEKDARDHIFRSDRSFSSSRGGNFLFTSL